jgi:hypothetical protein
MEPVMYALVVLVGEVVAAGPEAVTVTCRCNLSDAAVDDVGRELEGDSNAAADDGRGGGTLALGGRMEPPALAVVVVVVVAAVVVASAPPLALIASALGTQGSASDRNSPRADRGLAGRAVDLGGLVADGSRPEEWSPAMKLSSSPLSARSFPWSKKSW